MNLVTYTYIFYPARLFHSLVAAAIFLQRTHSQGPFHWSIATTLSVWDIGPSTPGDPDLLKTIVPLSSLGALLSGSLASQFSKGNN